MYIEKLKLKNFRNYSDAEINFNKNWNILIGNNGAGKTNILEAIYYSATTRSPRTLKIENLIKYNEQNFCVDIFFNKNENTEILRNFYSENIENLKDLKKYKKIILDKKEIKFSDLLGKIPFVYFVPEDLFIIKGESILRRKFLDFVLFQIYPNYKFLVKKYNDLLRKRNFLLKEIKYNRSRIQYLDEWTAILVQAGIEIYKKRKELVNIFNLRLETEYKKIYFKDEDLEIKYISFLDSLDFFENNVDNKTDDELFKFYFESLKKNYDREIKYGFTLIGPHRDDLQLNFNHQDVKKYGSQGQQRLYILTLKILSADIIKYFLQENPILIFDDVFSELDMKNIERLINVLNKNYQVFVSAVEIEKIEQFFDKNSTSIFKVKDGVIV
jgi:DNA replication and repair protein RecF